MQRGDGIRRWLTLQITALAPIALFALAPPGALAQGLAVELDETSLAVSGAGAGGQVVLLSVERRPVEFASRLETLVRSAADEDNDGQVEFPLDAPPAEASIWLAIDAATGQFGTASPIDGAPFPFPEPLGLTADPDSGGGVVGRRRSFLHPPDPGTPWRWSLAARGRGWWPRRGNRRSRWPSRPLRAAVGAARRHRGNSGGIAGQRPPLRRRFRGACPRCALLRRPECAALTLSRACAD